MQSKQPLVSVMMTVYNREMYITEAIESVLQSTYTNFELIIVDDCSKDNSMGIANSFAEKDARIFIFQNAKNLGDYPNRNKAASYAKGEYLMYVDSDDTIEHDAIAYVVDSFRKFPLANYATIYHGSDFSENSLLTSAEAIHKHFFKRGFLHFGPGGTVVRRSFFQAIGGFPEKYGPANDMYYNVKAACNSAVILMKYNYLYYREHEFQENKNIFGYLYNTYLYYKDFMHLPEMPLTEAERKYMLMKSKRRFVVNSFKYLKTTGNFRKTVKAWRLAGFGLRDAWTGLFQV